jgi:hypothetical protein
MDTLRVQLEAVAQGALPAEEPLEAALQLERHHDHINYEAYKDLGLPLGSGMVESACKACRPETQQLCLAYQ